MNITKIRGHQLGLRLVGAMATAMLATGFVVATSPTAEAVTQATVVATSVPAFESIGGVDMQGACNRQYPGRGLVATVLNGASAYSWACVGGGVALGIDVTGACRVQYGQNAVAALGSMSNPWSWACQWSVTTQMRAAAAWAIAEKNSPLPAWSDYFHTYWSGRCESFVRQAEGFRFLFPSAIADFNWQNAHGRIHRDARPPRGALVYWGGGAYGHVAVSLGWGQAIGTYGYIGQRYPVRQYPVVGYLSNPYLGWAYPIGS